ncbi:multiple epidermal growth factor-like domains protein 6 [Crassostrea angulata]|uniref:multiple epidermal growth factor-like domains protein 6 n=1 Tax=Magallana angulata TaxID=2784310 RepID=UPI0022B1E630|nr:multiple epidermal growth factor-like domains protein 6 [Crassostrea angulata]
MSFAMKNLLRVHIVFTSIYLKTKTNCEELCPSGYYGPKCTLTCRPPSYGIKCQLECECREQDCDHVLGCTQFNCTTGFHGPNCGQTCRYPSYGIKCQSKCSCEEQQCSHITGCRALNGTNDTPLTDLPCQGQNQTTCLVLVNDTSNVGKEFF